MGDVHRFEPHGLQFKKPVLLTLGYKEPEFPEEYIHIYYYNALADNWSIMEKVEQDKENNTITAKITHFSAYVPGVGSYTIEEGISPNTSFFKNNNENVDLNKGNLHITRTDVSIPGRGVDLVIQTAFNSDGYFWANDDQNEWAIAPEIEKKKKYKLAAGWRFKFPALHYEPYASGGSRFLYLSENGQVYNLTNAIRTKIDQQIKKIIYVNGYRIYNESYKVVQTHYHHYKRVIELVRDKVVISCDVHFDEMEGYHELSDIYAYYPDGRIIQYRNLTTATNIEIHGKIKKIYDASMNNCLTFAYETGGDNKGQIDTITDSTGRILHFTYDNNDIILSLETDTHTTYNLIRYRVRNNRLLEIKHLEHGSDENSVVETLYDYTIDSGRSQSRVIH